MSGLSGWSGRILLSSILRNYYYFPIFRSHPRLSTRPPEASRPMPHVAALREALNQPFSVDWRISALPHPALLLYLRIHSRSFNSKPTALPVHFNCRDRVKKGVSQRVRTSQWAWRMI